MATLSSSWEPAAVVSRAPSPKARAQSPISRSTSPVPNVGDTATIVAFKNARDTFRKSLSEKDLKRIMIPTGPEDVVNEIEKWRKRHLNSKVAASVRSGLGQLQRFSASIDMLAQGTPSPGCLLWGSIKFVLTIVQDAVQAYEQLCKALIQMTDCLPRIEIYAETFLESTIVADCVNAFYVSAIRFWAKACKFYRRRRLWQILHVIWNDFDTEFGDLEADMIRNRDRVEGAALAEHIGDSKAAKVNQQSVNTELLRAQISNRRKEIISWLAPVAYDVEYFSNDLASARALRHPKTCRWILHKTEFAQLCDTCHGSGKSLLWIYANPGAGKTILSSFLIDHFESEELDPLREMVFYFFCKNTDVDKNSPTAVVRSLLYQLYKSVKDQKASQSLNCDLGAALDQSGQQSAVNFTVLWQLFYTHVINTTPATIVLDALDECQNPDQLIKGLKELSEVSSLKIIMTSRKEVFLHQESDNVSSIEVASEDIHADIAAFVEEKVNASSRLSHPLVRDLVITKLCNAHDGMFLWVYLVLKELKSCISMAQVQDALAKLPTGLDGIYKSILHRLQTSLTRSTFELCSKVLTWVVSAVRPLSIHEIKHALVLHYDMDGDTLLTDDRSFPYSEKDVELICGSLVMIRKGILQVIHLTVKEFLRTPQEPSGSKFSGLLINPDYGSLQLTLVCLRCIADYAEPLIDLESKVPQIDWALDSAALERCQARVPLLEYASFSWLVHLIDCKLDDLTKIAPTFQETFSSPKTFSWVEICLSSQPNSALRLLVGVDDVLDKFYGSRQHIQSQQEASSQFLASWCSALSQVFEEHGAILDRRPWEIHLIDLHDIFSIDPSLRKLWQESGRTRLRKKDLRLIGYRAPRLQQKKPPPHLQLQHSLQSGSSKPPPVFLVHDEVKNIYIWGERAIESDNHFICVQHDKTGQRLPPAQDRSVSSSERWTLIDHALSPNGRYLVLVYASTVSESNKFFGSLIVAWRINDNISFKRRMNCEPWARVVFSHTSNFELYDSSSRAIMFKDNNCCMTPIGTLDLLTGSRRPLPDNIIHGINMADGLFYSRNGQNLFASSVHEPSGTSIQARRAELLEPSHFVDFSWEDKSRHLVDVSPSARYLVLGPSFLFRGNKREEKTLNLHDTKFNVTLEFPLPKPLEVWDGEFYFSRDETRLTAFFFGRKGLNVMIWDCLGPASRLTNHATLDLDLQIWPRGIHMHSSATSAVVVTRTRSMHRIGLGDTVELLDASKSIDEYPYRLSTVSRDGSHWALVSYGREGGKVQNINLASPDVPAQHFDLDWSHSDIPEILTEDSNLPIGISPDLSVLIINAEVFDLTSTTNSKGSPERLTLTPFIMEAASALLRPHLHSIRWANLQCRISPCNSYVIYVGSGDQWGNRTRFSSAIYLYRIDLQKRTSARLELVLPENLISLDVSFHPSLPLIAMSYASPTAVELKEILEEAPPQRLAICNLKSLEMTILETPKDQSTLTTADHWHRSGWLPRLLFSDCGTSIYLERGEWYQKQLLSEIDQIDTQPVLPRCIHGSYISNSLSFNNSRVIFHHNDNTSVSLELIKFDDTDFVEGKTPAVLLRNITSYSSQFAAADRFLLLGANDDEKMRLLIAPHDERTPVIKTLSLTFAEAQSRLEKEWQRLRAESQDQDLRKVVETGND